MNVVLKFAPPAQHDEKIPYHKASLLFPKLNKEAQKALADDIKQNGLLNKIVLYEEKILDGRNRYVACRKVGVTPQFEQFTGDDPVAYVISVNAIRRHLTAAEKRSAIKEAIKLRPDWNPTQVANMLKMRRW